MAKRRLATKRVAMEWGDVFTLPPSESAFLNGKSDFGAMLGAYRKENALIQATVSKVLHENTNFHGKK